ncbi:GNAT family N-acetyltransferase [Pannonibacter sp. Pt2-lr]|uniref:GNAT family N-acetyltransferase n=1 Tax=Pannonibacter anstelovis TaxID=3121537 RepID=A0ABU7ZM38_9HYPH
MQAGLTKTLDTYEVTRTDMLPDDIPRLHELSIGVNWPHRPKDWELAISLGHGYVARDEIGRVLGSAMWFPMGPELATVGMVITSPRLQEHGAGAWLMRHVLAETAHRGKMLNATKAAYRLYLSLGFTPRATVYQHQGMAGEVPDGPGTAVPMLPVHAPEIVALDASAYGADRCQVFDRLFELSEGTVILREGKVAGFALSREFGRGRVIGPVVAETEEDAITVIRPHLVAHPGVFLRIDTSAEDGPLRRFLHEAGLSLFDTVTTMTLGSVPDCGPAITFGLVNHALG